MPDSKEERIRAEAYQRWEAEGRPEGAHERHWLEAAAALAALEAMETADTEGTANAVTLQEEAVGKPKRARVKKTAV